MAVATKTIGQRRRAMPIVPIVYDIPDEFFEACRIQDSDQEVITLDEVLEVHENIKALV